MPHLVKHLIAHIRDEARRSTIYQFFTKLFEAGEAAAGAAFEDEVPAAKSLVGLFDHLEHLTAAERHDEADRVWHKVIHAGLNAMAETATSEIAEFVAKQRKANSTFPDPKAAVHQ